MYVLEVARDIPLPTRSGLECVFSEHLRCYNTILDETEQCVKNRNLLAHSSGTEKTELTMSASAEGRLALQLS